jgi:hypothetical protein
MSSGEDAVLRAALRTIIKRCLDYEHINLVGRTHTAKKAGTLRHVIHIARVALGDLSNG